MIISSNTYPFDEYMDELGVSFEQDTVQKKSPYLNYGIRRIDYRFQKYLFIKNQELNDSLEIKRLKIYEINDKPVDYKSTRILFSPRSEERRVGKECRSRWSAYH